MSAPVIAGYSIAELMAVIMARELRAGEVAIMGAVSALPQAACRLARQMSAPGLWYIAGGSGAVNPRMEGLVPSSCDERLLDADVVLPLPEVVLIEGRGDVIDVFFVGGLQIDVHGSCNLGPIGDWVHPSLRGPGGVGLPLVTRAGRVIIYSMAHTRRTFVEQVDFISGPGFVDGANSSAGGKPALIVTPLCTMDFGPSHRARLRSLHPGVTLSQVLDATGFAPEIGQLTETPAPTPRELELLRRIDGTGVLREGAVA